MKPTAAFQRHALVPKPSVARSTFPVVQEGAIPFSIGPLVADERKALARIVETADLIQVEGGRAFLLVPAPAKLLDVLAAFGAETEDRENDLEDEPSEDDEPSLGVYQGWNGEDLEAEEYLDHGAEPIQLTEWDRQHHAKLVARADHPVVSEEVVGPDGCRGRWVLTPRGGAR